jgi:nucleoid-associated protein YejK
MIAITGNRSVEPECGKYVQGFLTNMNRFVDRKEGARIAFEAKQVNNRVSWENVDWETRDLYSEDLY